jgi:hypothetical protein
MDRTESNLAPLDADTVPDLLGSRRVTLARGQEELQRAVTEHRAGHSLGEHLLWLAFLLAVAEAIYANYRAKAPAGLSASLKVSLSGKLDGGKGR